MVCLNLSLKKLALQTLNHLEFPPKSSKHYAGRWLPSVFFPSASTSMLRGGGRAAAGGVGHPRSEVQWMDGASQKWQAQAGDQPFLGGSSSFSFYTFYQKIGCFRMF